MRFSSPTRAAGLHQRSCGGGESEEGLGMGWWDRSVAFSFGVQRRKLGRRGDEGVWREKKGIGGGERDAVLGRRGRGWGEWGGELMGVERGMGV